MYSKGTTMKLSNQKGQALVELAIILPLLVLLVFGVFEFGRVMYIKNTLNYAARLGARYASTSSTYSSVSIQSYVTSNVPTLTGLSVSVNPSTAPSVHGTTPVTVTITKSFTTVVPNLPPFSTLLNRISLSGQASMLYE
jgi:Flp pilus assembly protein TadG